MNAITTTRPSTTTATAVVQNDKGAATVKVTKQYANAVGAVTAQVAANAANMVADVSVTRLSKSQQMEAAKQDAKLVAAATATETCVFRRT